MPAGMRACGPRADLGWGAQLVEAHLIPDAVLREADLRPGRQYPTALPGSYVTARHPSGRTAVPSL